MITIHQAVTAARRYFAEMSEMLGLSDQQKTALRVEETDSNQSEWLVTLSIPDRDTASFPSWRAHRDYKILAVDKETGEVKSMKIRPIQNA